MNSNAIINEGGPFYEGFILKVVPCLWMVALGVIQKKELNFFFSLRYILYDNIAE